MKKIIFFICFYLWFDILFSQNICYVKVNMGDCHSCFGYLSYLNKLKKDVKKIFVFQSDYKQDKAYIINTFFNDSLMDEIIFSDSIYQILNTFNITSIHIFNKQGLLAQFPLREIKSKLYLINNPDTITFDEKLPVSCKFKIENGILYTYNYPLSEIAIYDLNRQHSPPMKLKLTHKMIQISYNKHFHDTTSYYISNNFIEKMYIPKFIGLNQIWAFDVKEDTIFFVSKHLYPKPCFYKGKADTCFFDFYSMFTVYNNSIQKVEPIRLTIEDELSRYDGPGIGFAGTSINVIKDKSFFNVNKITLSNKDNYFIGQWEYRNNEWVYGKPVKIDLPDLNYKYNLGYGASNYTLHYPYLFCYFSKELSNIETGANVKFPIHTGDLSYLVGIETNKSYETKITYQVMDFSINKNRIKLLIARDKQLYIQELDIVNQKIISEKLIIDLNKFSFRSDPQFEDFNTLLILPSNSNCIVRLKI